MGFVVFLIRPICNCPGTCRIWHRTMYVFVFFLVPFRYDGWIRVWCLNVEYVSAVIFLCFSVGPLPKWHACERTMATSQISSLMHHYMVHHRLCHHRTDHSSVTSRHHAHAQKFSNACIWLLTNIHSCPQFYELALRFNVATPNGQTLVFAYNQLTLKISNKKSILGSDARWFFEQMLICWRPPDTPPWCKLQMENNLTQFIFG